MAAVPVHAQGSEASASFAELQLTVAQGYLGQRNFDAADSTLALVTDSVGLPKDSTLFEVLFLRGRILQRAGRYELSVPYYERALSFMEEVLTKHSQRKVDLLHTLGMAAASAGERHLGIRYVEQAIRKVLEGPGEFSMQAAEIYNNLGLIYKSISNYGTALGYYEHALDIVDSLQPDNYSVLAMLRNNLGRLYYEVGQLEFSKDLISEAIALDEKSGRPNPAHFSSLGLTLSELGEYEEALANCLKAKEMRLAQFGPNSPRVVYYHTLEGRAMLDLGRHDEALAAYAEARRIIEREETPNLDDVTLTFFGLAEAVLGQKDYEKALSIVNEGFALMVPDFRPSRPSENPVFAWDPQEYLSLALESGYRTKAKIYLLRGEDTNSLEDLQLAFQNYSELINLYKLGDAYIFESRSKAIFSRKGKADWAEAISCGFQLYNRTGDKKYVASAFQMMEEYKTVRLIRRLHHEQGRLSILPESVRAERDDIRFEIIGAERSLVEAQNANAPDSTLKSLRQKLFDLQEKQVSFAQRVEEEFQYYSGLTLRSSAFSLQNLMEELPKDAVVLDYFMVKDQVLGMAISHEDIKVASLPVSPGLFQNVDELSEREFADWGYSIFASWVMPFHIQGQEYSHLYLLPDGKMFSIPFDLMLTEPQQGVTSFAKMPYAIKQWGIQYHYSAEQLVFGSRSREKATAKLDVLAVAPSFIGQQQTLFATRQANDSTEAIALPVLPFAAREAEQVADIFGGKVLSGLQATEGAFRNDATQAKRLHLATHALLDTEAPLFSRLVLESDNAGRDDGLLHTYELYQMDLPAELVTISACNSGNGEYLDGEGVVSLAQGFLYAGVPNVVMSQWAVPDEATASIMESFYSNQKEGMGYGEALRQAKLAYLDEADGLTAAPYFWGSWRMIGSIEDENSLPWIYFLGFGLLIIGVVIYRRR